MKKRFFSLLIFLILCSIMPIASAEPATLDGFTVTFPENFIAELKEKEPGEGTDFFAPSSAYQAESVYEMLTFQIGTNSGLDAVFSENFGFARREDLDLSLLTEDQLHAEAGRFTDYLDSAYPVYMTYQTPKSMEVDSRLGLVVTGYYTDYNNALTGEFRAYEFYYLNKTIIIYYDTQIEGTYFNESVFELPDSIVSGISFEVDPTSQPMNPNWFSGTLKMAIPVLTALVIALILGFIFGKIKRKPKPEPDAVPAPVKAEAPPVTLEKPEVSEAPQPKPAVKQPKPILTEDTEEESVDWQSMLADLRKQAAETPNESVVLKTEKPVDPQKKTETEPAESDAKQPNKGKDDTNIINDTIEASFKELGRLAEMIKDKLHLGKSEETQKENNNSQSEEELSPEETNYESYLDKVLPKNRYKHQPAVEPEKKSEPAATEETAPVSEMPQTEPKASPPPQKAQTDTAEMPEKGKKEGGFIARALNSIVKKIESSDEPDPVIPEFESRIEMHISEKTEKNPIDKLMPGLFDDEPEEEQLEIVLDEDVDELAEMDTLEEEPAETEEKSQKNTGLLRRWLNKLTNDKNDQ